MKCSICKINPAIKTTRKVRLEDTSEWEKFINFDDSCLTEEAETSFIELRILIDSMKEKLDQIKVSKNWDGNYAVFTKIEYSPCSDCISKQNIVKKRFNHTQYKKVQLPNLLQHAGIKLKYTDADINNCSSWIKDYVNTSLYLYVAVGIGKTYIAAALLKHDIENGKSALFITTADLLDKIRACYDDKNNMRESQVVHSYMDIDNLYLDDIGSEKVTDWAIHRLYTIIDHRYSEDKRTVFTSNLSLDELKTLYGDRFTSRIIEMCGNPIKLTGEDRRLKALA